MAKLFVCAVMDCTINAYAQPFYAASRAHALRSFRDAVNGDGKDQLSKHPSDFTLYQLALFDEEEGTFDRAVEVIARGKDVREPDHDA